jgi:hypothetical protein
MTSIEMMSIVPLVIGTVVIIFVFAGVWTDKDFPHLPPFFSWRLYTLWTLIGFVLVLQGIAMLAGWIG